MDNYSSISHNFENQGDIIEGEARVSERCSQDHEKSIESAVAMDIFHLGELASIKVKPDLPKIISHKTRTQLQVHPSKDFVSSFLVDKATLPYSAAFMASPKASALGDSITLTFLLIM